MTFGRELMRFAAAVDNVSEDTFNRAWGLLFDHLKEHYSAVWVQLLVIYQVDRTLGLTSIKSNDRNTGWSMRVLDDTGNYKNHASFAFYNKRNLWLATRDNSPITHDTAPEDLVDLWNDNSLDKLPHYEQSPHGDRVESEVLLIVKQDNADEPEGVLVLELKSKPDVDDDIKEEMQNIARAISRLYLLNKAFEVQVSGTNNQLRELGRLTHQVAKKRSRIFLAYPEGAKSDVLGVVKTVLDDYGLTEKVFDWKPDSATGIVLARLLAKMSESFLAICYLSKPDEGNGNTYSDSRSVLLELGLALAHHQEDPFGVRAPIIIREADDVSGRKAFNYADLYLIEVGRLANHRLNDDDLKTSLKATLKKVLDGDV